MTNRERVNTILNHRDADNTPFSLGCSIVDGIAKFAKNKFKRILARRSPPPIAEAAILNWTRFTQVLPPGYK